MIPPSASRRFPALASVGTPPLLQAFHDNTQLPSPLNAFIGREHELADVCRLVHGTETRLLTLTGPGGVGKTRLAIAAAEILAPAFTQGVVFVPLAAITDPMMVINTIATQLGVRVDSLGAALDSVFPNGVSARSTLLVLDNFEQVLEAGSALVSLLKAFPSIRILVTSRASLGVTGEQVFPVKPLALPAPGVPWHVESLIQLDAVQLFVNRARTVNPHFHLDKHNAAQVVAICVRLDGLPLAIELAAARVSVLSPVEICADLDDSLRVLSKGPADAPPRLRTMRDAIAWSWNLLAPDERKLLRRLSVFAGGCTLEAAEAVSGKAHEDVLENLSALVRHCLLQRAESNEGRSRFNMLETVRAFAGEQLAVADDVERCRKCHAEFFARMADRLTLTWWLPREIADDRANIYAALDWSIKHRDPDLIYPLAIAVWQLFEPARGYDMLERALDSVEAASSAVASRYVLLTAATAQFAMFRGDHERAQVLLEQCIGLARGIPQDASVALAFLAGGWTAVAIGSPELGEHLGKVARRAWQQLGETHWIGEAMTLLGETAAALGRIDVAEAHYGAALEILRREGPPIAVAGTLGACAALAARKSDFRRAAMLAGECLHLNGDSNEDPSLCIGTGLTLAEALAALGQPVHAARLLGAVESYTNRVGIAVAELEGGRLQRLLDMIHARATQGDIVAARTEGERLPLEEWLPWASELARSIGTAAAPPGPAETLTARETDVLRLVAAGCSNLEIADLLSRSERTIENHMSHILAKLNVSSRTAAVAVATREGMIERSDRSVSDEHPALT